MTLGFWKQVTDPLVIKKYAYLNEYDISDYDENDPGKDSDGPYGEIGIINLMIEHEVVSKEEITDQVEIKKNKLKKYARSSRMIN